MKIKLIISWAISIFLVVVPHAILVNAASSGILESIKACLPVAQAGTPYKYSIANYADIKSSRWLLVRAHDGNPYVAPSYSVIEVRNKSCKNYHKYPVSDISRTSSVPKQVIGKFTQTIQSDLGFAGKLFEKTIRQQYPGRSRQELQRLGVYGMDSL
jgi:hypothetical protein